MVKYQDECVGCPREIGCLGNACPHIHVPVYYCDKCGRDTEYEHLRRLEGGDICTSCFFDTVDEDHPNPYELFSKLEFVDEG